MSDDLKKRIKRLRKKEEEFKATVDDLLVGVVVHDADTRILYCNPQACLILGLTHDQMFARKARDPIWTFFREDMSVLNPGEFPVNQVIATGEKVANQILGFRKPDCRSITWITFSAVPIFTKEGVLERVVVNFIDTTERIRMWEALEKQIAALTRPLDGEDSVLFEDLFSIDEIQRIQDEFSKATGVASIITQPDGTPITNVSNTTALCFDLIRQTEKGCANCYRSDAELGRHHPDGPIVQQCLSAGLWDAGASISVGGRHVANWLIGQVRDETQTEEQMRAYAREIGADEEAVAEAFHRIPVMSREHFEQIAQILFTLANQLSASAYQNIQQARFIAARKKAEAALAESEEKYRQVFESESDAILMFDGRTRQFIDVNSAAVQLYGYTREEFFQITHHRITADPKAAETIIPAVLEGKKLQPFMSRHRKKDGTVFPVEISPISFTWKGSKVVCGVIRDVTEREIIEAERSRTREELRHLASELSMAEQHGRQRVAAELHDSVSQLLSSSVLRLDMLRAEKSLPESAARTLDTVCNTLRESLRQTQSLTFELSCPLLHELGPAAALEELCESMSHDHAVRFEFHGDKQPLSLPFDNQLILYRSARELMINVVKHSQATRARVALIKEDNTVRICVEDDGKGFDSTAAGKGFSPSGGFGLFNMSAYLGHVGGTLNIDSAPGQGTWATLTLPLEK